MSEAKAFLHMLQETPEDMNLRLVYADWLEERGDPRGTFIRLQCQRADLTQHDSPWKEILAQESALLKEYQAEWSKPIVRLVDELEYHRGFIEHVRLTAAKFLKNADRLFRVAPVRSIQLTRLQFLLPEVAACPHLARVKHLDLSHNGPGIGSKTLRDLVQSPFIGQMTSLALNDCEVGPASAAVLGDAPNLAGLQALRLGRNALGDAGAHALASSPHWPGLHELTLYGNELLCSGAIALAAAPTIRLRHLDLGMNRIGNEGAAAIANSPSCAELRRLDLRDNTISNVGVLALAQSPHLGRLEHLDLSGNRIGDRGLAALAASTTLSHLVSLNLESNEFSAAAAQALKSSTNFPRMTKLLLGRHALTLKK